MYALCSRKITFRLKNDKLHGAELINYQFEKITNFASTKIHLHCYSDYLA
jgi:hypothetical protein